MTGFDETVPPDDDPDTDATTAGDARDNAVPDDRPVDDTGDRSASPEPST
ncbi:hypothetical protein [uncultured Jatrophihabitans sp.]